MYNNIVKISKISSIYDGFNEIFNQLIDNWGQKNDYQRIPMHAFLKVMSKRIKLLIKPIIQDIINNTNKDSSYMISDKK